jgi:hypothetical protein
VRTNSHKNRGDVDQDKVSNHSHNQDNSHASVHNDVYRSKSKDVGRVNDKHHYDDRNIHDNDYRNNGNGKRVGNGACNDGNYRNEVHNNHSIFDDIDRRYNDKRHEGTKKRIRGDDDGRERNVRKIPQGTGIYIVRMFMCIYIHMDIYIYIYA